MLVVVYESKILPPDSSSSSYMHFGKHVSSSGNVLLSSSDLVGIEGAIYVYCKASANDEDWNYITKIQSPYVTSG